MTYDNIRFARRFNAFAIALGAFAAPAFAAPSPITPPFTVAPLNGGAQVHAARGADGSYVLAWLNRASDGTNPQVPHARIYRRDGSPVGPEFEIGLAGFNPSNSIDVAVAGNGNFLIAYDEYQSSTDTLGYRVQRFSPLGAPIGAAVNVGESPAGAAGVRGISVAADRDGDFVVAWENYSLRYLSPRIGYFALIQTLDSTRARPFNADGTPRTSEIVVHNDTFRLTARSTSPNAPEVAMDPDGEFVVVRQSNHDGDRSLFARRYHADGSALGIERRVTPLGADVITDTSVTMADSGNFVVGWGLGDYPNYKPYFRRFNAVGQALGAQQRITTETPVSRLSLSGDAQGNFIAIWIGQKLVGQSYTSAGVARGATFEVDSQSGFRDLPAIASDPVGNFGVAWFNTVVTIVPPDTYTSIQSVQSQMFSAP